MVAAADKAAVACLRNVSQKSDTIFPSFILFRAFPSASSPTVHVPVPAMTDAPLMLLRAAATRHPRYYPRTTALAPAHGSAAQGSHRYTESTAQSFPWDGSTVPQWRHLSPTARQLCIMRTTALANVTAHKHVFHRRSLSSGIGLAAHHPVAQASCTHKALLRDCARGTRLHTASASAAMQRVRRRFPRLLIIKVRRLLHKKHLHMKPAPHVRHIRKRIIALAEPMQMRKDRLEPQSRILPQVQSSCRSLCHRLTCRLRSLLEAG